MEAAIIVTKHITFNQLNNPFLSVNIFCSIFCITSCSVGQISIVAYVLQNKNPVLDLFTKSCVSLTDIAGYFLLLILLLRVLINFWIN